MSRGLNQTKGDAGRENYKTTRSTSRIVVPGTQVRVIDYTRVPVSSQGELYSLAKDVLLFERTAAVQ